MFLNSDINIQILKTLKISKYDFFINLNREIFKNVNNSNNSNSFSFNNSSSH
jgi:hypothetical protein